MGEDVSKKTVAILLLVAILISFLGTWAVLSATNDISFKEAVGDNTAEVYLGIHKPNDDSSANVHLGIINPEEGK